MLDFAFPPHAQLSATVQVGGLGFGRGALCAWGRSQSPLCFCFYRIPTPAHPNHTPNPIPQPPNPPTPQPPNPSPPPQAIQQAHIQYSLKLGASVSACGSGPLSNIGSTGAGLGGQLKMLGGGGGLLPEVTPGLHYFPEVRVCVGLLVGAGGHVGGHVGWVWTEVALAARCRGPAHADT